MVFQERRPLLILLTLVAALLIPLIAMQFTTEVRWTTFDFIVAGVLLLGTGLLIEIVLRKTDRGALRILAILAVLAIFVLIWLELAVGIIGTPWAGT